MPGLYARSFPATETGADHSAYSDMYWPGINSNLMTQTSEQHATNYVNSRIANPFGPTVFTQADVALRFCFGYWCAYVRTFQVSVLATILRTLPEIPEPEQLM